MASPTPADVTDAARKVTPSPQPPPPWPTQPSQDDLEDVTQEYRMDHHQRGHCLIFNQVTFSSVTGQPARDGSDADAEALKTSFSRLAFSVRALKDLTAGKLQDVLREYRNKDHSDCDCFVLVLLSHGYDGHFYAHDRQLSIDWVARQFRPDACPSLAGKPKLFFIQACRGDKFDPGTEVPDGCDELDNAGGRIMRVPLESDFYFFYSTPPGYFSWRNSQFGSWFVQQLTSILDRHGDRLELQHLVLLVQRHVATDCASVTGDRRTSGMKQMPVTVSQLRKLLFFRPKK